jgi:hypothetical protein
MKAELAVRYTVEVEFFQTAAETVCGQSWQTHEAYKPSALHQLIGRRPFIWVYAKHSPNHLFSFLGYMPKASFTETQED